MLSILLGRKAWVFLAWLYIIGCFGVNPEVISVSAITEDTTLTDDTSVLTPSEILLKVYDETRGMRWDKHDNWLQNNDVCTWYGVTCYSNSSTTDQRRLGGHVQKLDLSSNRLLGTLPPEVFQLPYIESIDVRDNPDLDMSFLEIAEAQYLREIAISTTNIKNFEGIQAATQLQQLHMTSLGLTGTIPTQIFQLSSLTGLFANYNKFSGNISTSIGNLTSLEEIYLFGSDLSGQIPSEFGLLTNLKVATLAENSFSGTLPSEINLLTLLRTLAINRAAGLEKGSGITGSLPSFSRLRDITDLRLQSQRFSGSIPADFINSAPTNEIIKVELSGNAITGTVPTSLTNLKRLNLFLEDNKISSVPETVCNAGIGDWMGGNVGVEGCDGFLCRPGFFSQLGRATTDNPCVACDGATYWGSTRCESSVSTTNTSTGYAEREVLITLYNRMGGRYWRNDDGWLNPSVPICEWYGVECTDEKVTGLMLKNNDLSNSPPESLFSLPGLTLIDFESNSIDFPFKGIARATKLESLLLTSCDISSLENVGELNKTAIRRLHLSSNLLDGTLPTELFSLVSLEELDISHNKLVGSIPVSISAMTNLELFSFSKNGLSGQIPTTIGSLTRLKYFLGFENSFSGSLPESLENLTLLQSISLHQSSSPKGIGGSLPAFRNLGQLTSLQVDSNNLEGPLPEDFLRNTQVNDAEIEVRLNDNQLEGEVPEEWASRFQSLYLDLSGNRISGIGSKLCSTRAWNQGTVETFGCAGILCAPGTFNEFGRQTGSEALCRSCSHALSVQYYGAKTCDDSENIAIQETSELQSLMEFFDSTNGNNWKNNAGWMVSNNPCSGWYGVECDADGKVVSIALESNGLTGTPSPVLFKLPMLHSLSLKNNKLAFSFEGIAEASSLTVLILSGTNLDSVDGISKATGLAELHLADNMVAGSMPEEILQLTNLRKLYLNFNQLTGTIPPKISSLVSLEELYLFNNRLGGQLPASIGLLSQLKELSLAENSFSGTLPPELNDLTNLEVLSIQREGGTGDAEVGISQVINTDVGAGITGPLLPFDGLKYLRRLYLGSQSLSGTIPFNFLNGVENKDLSIEIDLISNRLTGSVPPALSQFGDVSLFLAGNRLSGIPDGLCKKGTWMQGGVAAFQCNALLCPPGTYNSRGRQKDSRSACLPCPSGTTAEYYGSFACIGEEQARSLSERSILERFFSAAAGSWNHQEGWLNPGLSICDWAGITCVDGQESVSSISLADNGLMGSVPSEFFLLPNLRLLDLSRNTINVSFQDIKKAEKLEYLQLDATGLTSLSGLEMATGLKLLHLAENTFLGVELAHVVASLTGLESLDISRNDIRVMPSLEGHSNVAFLACAQCRLTGVIPSWLTNLTRLKHIDFEANSLSGSLPTLLSKLTDLRYLNVADQVSNGGPGLSGSLPNFAGMPHLQELYLQRNNFTSSIPESFLRDVNIDGTVIVDLAGNSIEGAIPQALSHIQSMNLYLAGNRIDNVPDDVCTSGWNQFNESTSDCSRILCPPATFNVLGRATPDLPCIGCTEPDYSVFYGSIQCGPAFEKNSVYSLFESLGGTSWTHADGWKNHDDYCSWFGVTCYEGGLLDGFVQTIILSENNLQGTLSPSVWKIPHLKELDLRKNNIVVTFDGIEHANSLETLHLSETKVSTLVGISAAPNLQYVHLTNCDLSGYIPDELFEMTELKALYLNFNDLVGTVPSAIGGLSQLQELYLFHNSLNGTLPTELGLLANVEILSLGENKFTGSLPFELNGLQELRVLALQREESEAPSAEVFFMVVEDLGLTGGLISFNNTPKLREIYLGDNHLDGGIPADFLLGVDDTKATIRVDLSSNMFHGTIPVSLARFDDLRLDLTGNMVREIPDELCQKTGWFDGELAAGCDAFLCPPGTFNEYGRRVGAEVCESCNFRGAASFYGSRMCGALLPQAMTENYMLQELYAATGGLSWTNTENWLREDVSVCSWFGVFCEIIDGKETVTELALPKNNLVGLVPSIVFYLPALRRLDLGRNQVWAKFGDIQYSALEDLSLDETNLGSLEGISRASNLRTLHLQKTALSGQTIPDELYTLVNLTVLDLEACGLTGQLSENVGGLKKLKTLLLDRNALTGQLPSTLGELIDLEDLFLSDNNFWGTLPSELNGLSSLKSLFLDSSKQGGAGISGPLLSFSNMPKLRSVHLGSNSLTGPIPFDFLAGVDTFEEVIDIDVASNHLTGSVPVQLSAFSKLNLDVTDNDFSSIDGSLCSKSSWQQEAVGTYSCSAIMCPQGTYNQVGRQSSEDTPCLQCAGAIVSPYMGQKSCLNDEKTKERHILELFYNATNGRDWKNNNGWLDENTDYCNWYGITCVASVVDTISLGSNNLAGEVPADIFHLWSLRVVWLYSNPIEFQFDGVRKASKLVDLRLDSTGLKSLEGLSDALALVDIDVRFNRLQGDLPDLSKLSNLRTFSCSANRLSGSLPSFAENTALVYLRASGNAFSGKLPAFNTHPYMKALDVSSNDLSGNIPDNLLAAADTSAKIFVDLSSNSFTGAIPSSLSRFTDLTIYVRDNCIDTLPAALCAMQAWNQGDVGLEGCDAIACPPQTYSANAGRASRGGYKCEPCEEARFFGETSCVGNSDLSVTASVGHTSLWIGGVLFSSVSMTLCNFF